MVSTRRHKETEGAGDVKGGKIEKKKSKSRTKNHHDLSHQPERTLEGKQKATATKHLESFRRWLFKSGPVHEKGANGFDLSYSIDDMKRDKVTAWDGVRNYEARKYLKAMKIGDLGLFYHSHCKEPGIVGLVRICKEAYPDPSAEDPKRPDYDERQTPDNPIWVSVDVEFVEKFPNQVDLNEIKNQNQLKDMYLIRRHRLSVMPVTDVEFDYIMKMSGQDIKVKDDNIT